MPYSGPPRDMPRAVAPAVAPSISVVMVPMMDRRSQAKGPPTMLMKAIMTVNMDSPGPKEENTPARMATLVSSLVRPTRGPALTAVRMKE